MSETTPAATGTGDLAAVLDPMRERAAIALQAGFRVAEDALRLLAVADAVLGLHRMSDLGKEQHCVHCAFTWPCPTVRAVSAALVKPPGAVTGA